MYDAPYEYDRYEDYDRPLGPPSGRSYQDRGDREDPRAGSYVPETGYGYGRPNRRDDEGRYGGLSEDDFTSDEWRNRRIR